VRLEAHGPSLLAGADLSGADLSHALLVETDLRGADLSGAVLDGASLTGARIHGLHGIPASSAGLACEWVDVSAPGEVPRRDGPEALTRALGG
jgi:uncharacterized protein YjbI with pentapeptide repeats